MKIRQMVDGFVLFKTAEGVSQKTLQNYTRYLNQFATWAGDADSDQLSASMVADFIVFMRDEYVPRRIGGDTTNLSSQSIRNIWVAMKSFSAWAQRTLDVPDVMAGGRVPVPRATSEPRIPFTQDEVRLLLNSVKPRRGQRGRGVVYLRQLGNRAMLMTLLDTGIRNSELCSATIGDWHASSGQLRVYGKGQKYRLVYTGAKTRPVLWQYLQERPDGGDPARPLFVTDSGTAYTQHWLARKVRALGDSAGVTDCYPHRFRYTFAIQYLRNGGDVFTLQSLLGHSSLKMVRYYLALAQTDVEAAHRRASPVDNWL